MESGQSPTDPTSPSAETKASSQIDATMVTEPRHPDAPRRCFICLTDEDDTDLPGSWVDPCPCTLEAHQDCMLSWVTDCERTNRPLTCPVCKSKIEMEGSWDPVVSLSDIVGRRFSRASPYMLFTAFSMGVQFSTQMYGAMALWTFSGKDVLFRYALGPKMVIDGRQASTLVFARERMASALVLMNIAPTLLLATVFPGFSNKVFLPAASVYGVYHAMQNERFVSWPPSPQLAMAIFPYIRSIYYNMWRELVLPYELQLNRQLLGLPPQEQPPQAANARNNAPRNPGAGRNREPGIIDLLQTLLDALGGDEEDLVNRNDGAPNGEAAPGDGHEDRLLLELVIEEIPDGEDNAALVQPGVQLDNVGNEQVEELQPLPGQDNQGEPGNHEAPPAPPAARVGLGGILSHLSNAIVSALILPGISFLAGEALRLTLPSKWTTISPRNAWLRSSALMRPGLLQQQWGRSLVGGCLYIVLRDLVRVYTKSRKVAALANRRVKNVDRPRHIVSTDFGV